MEVIQWTALWGTFKDEFENEKNMLGGSLDEKAAEALKLRVIEHVLVLKLTSLVLLFYLFLLLYVVIILLLRAIYSYYKFMCQLSLIKKMISLQNILVVSKYYSRITLKRLADLLCLTIQVCLHFICEISFAIEV